MHFIKYSIFIIFIATLNFDANAQMSKVRKARIAAKHNYNDLEEAKKSIDIAITDEKSMHEPKTWLVRGDIYLKLTVSKEDKFKKLDVNPIDDSYYSYQKAYRFDLKQKYTKTIYSQLEIIKGLYRNEGIELFNSQNYKRSYLCFDNVLKIGTFINKKAIDTIMLYNIALVSELNGNNTEAIKYYQKCIDYKYGGPKVYNYIAKIEKQQGDTAQYISYLKQGIEEYPQNNDTLLLELINYYIDNDDNYLAIEFLTQAIGKDPFNETFYFAKGALFDKLGEYDNAIMAYENSLVIDSNYFDAYFNLGILYFNKGATLLKSANNIPPSKQKEYDKLIKNAYDEFIKALVPLEKAHELRERDISTITVLKDIYLKLKTVNNIYSTKYKEFDVKLKENTESKL